MDSPEPTIEPNATSPLPPQEEVTKDQRSSRSRIPSGVKLFASWPDASSPSSAGEAGSSQRICPLARSDIQEKFTSPSRERLSPTESKRRIEEKQSKAQEARERLLEEKAQRYKEKAKRVEDIKAWQEEQQAQKLSDLNQKLQKAEELRRQQITKKKQNAHEEELKVEEILFINKIEAENKRYDVMSKERDAEARLLDLQEERQRKKKEENAAKEAAAEVRKRVLEAEHQAKREQILEKIREKDQKVEQQMLEKEKERREQVSAKTSKREMKLSAMSAAQAATVEQLQRRIQERQEAYEKRKQENMDLIRQRAFELSVRRCSESPHDDHTPRPTPYETRRMCSVCRVLIGSEIYLYSHLRGKRHQDAIKQQYGQSVSAEDIERYNMDHIIEAPPGTSDDDLHPEFAKMDKMRLKSIKKRISKLRNRLFSQSESFESQDMATLFPASRKLSSQVDKKSKLHKHIRDLNQGFVIRPNPEVVKLPQPLTTSQMQSLERILTGIEQIVKSSSNEKCLFSLHGGLRTFSQLIDLQILSKSTYMAEKVCCHLLYILGLVCAGDMDNCLYVFHSNIMTSLLDFLELRLTEFLNQSSNPISRGRDLIMGSLFKVICLIFDAICKFQPETKNELQEEFYQRILDIISFAVSIGLVDKVSLSITNSQGPVDNEPDLAEFLMDALSFVTSLIALLVSLRRRIGSNSITCQAQEDSTQLTITLCMTQIVGVVPLLYGILLHTQVFSRGHSTAVIPPEVAKHALSVAEISMSLLNHVALLDLSMLQATLGSEGLSLQLRHISSYLLWYCSHWKGNQRLVHEVILLLGFFALNHPDNQAVLHSGQRPTILQQLCTLPFDYFSNEVLKGILFPTFISCCFKNESNRAILEMEMSPVMLSSFLEAALEAEQLKAVTKTSKGTATAIGEEKWSLASRFPKSLWLSAKDFFASGQGNSS